jgi:hypothetical protein
MTNDFCTGVDVTTQQEHESGEPRCGPGRSNLWRNEMRAFILAAVAGLAVGALGTHQANAMTNTSPAAVRLATEAVDVSESVHCRPYRHWHAWEHRWTHGCHGGAVGVETDVEIRRGHRARVHEGSRTTIRSGTTTRGETSVRSRASTSTTTKSGTSTSGSASTGTKMEGTGRAEGGAKPSGGGSSGGQPGTQMQPGGQK